MLVELLLAHGLKPKFTTVEVGALPLTAEPEPFHALPRLFPGSRNIAFEADEAVCERLSKDAEPGMEFYPHALGRAVEPRIFHATAHPACGSLYEPDERWADLFQNLEIFRKTHRGIVDAITLEHFARQNSIESVDFIKIDIQGAELEVFHGAGDLLNSVVCIVCEVEFVPLYKNQPLFGDIDAFLRSRGFVLHKFGRISGRVMKPLVFGGDEFICNQAMWTDAVFVADLMAPERLTGEQLLKLAVFMEMYGSPDVSLYLISQFDRRYKTNLAEHMIHHFAGTNAGRQHAS